VAPLWGFFCEHF